MSASAAKMKFRVLAGKHHQSEGGVVKTYVKGDIVETENDLTKHNSKDPAASRKFERVDDTTPASTPKTAGQPPLFVPPQKDAPPAAQRGHDPAATLESMTEDELRKVCDAEEINHKNIKGKNELIKVIRTSTKI